MNRIENYSVIQTFLFGSKALSLSFSLSSMHLSHQPAFTFFFLELLHILFHSHVSFSEPAFLITLSSSEISYYQTTQLFYSVEFLFLLSFLPSYLFPLPIWRLYAIWLLFIFCKCGSVSGLSFSVPLVYILTPVLFCVYYYFYIANLAIRQCMSFNIVFFQRCLGYFRFFAFSYKL